MSSSHSASGVPTSAWGCSIISEAEGSAAALVDIGFGFRNFENYRIRALLYAGRPNWRVLGSIVVR